MRALLQRVTEASVAVNGDTVGRCGPGLLIFVCAMPGDDEATAKALATKIGKLRIFRDAAGKTNLNLVQAGGSALVVSQFTLAADTSRGNRPGFSRGAGPDEAKALYLQFADYIREIVPTETGQFGAEMQVSLVNDGPFTLWLDTDAP
jgi:D-tyrosyl-tRNA(Tyr) deacylase